MRFALQLLAAMLLLGAAPPRVTYRNPVLDTDFPDPSVIRVADGTYYAYGTQGGEPIRNIQVARSNDLVHWRPVGDALPVKPRWAGQTQDIWAPDVMAANGRYYLYYSAKPDAALTDKERGLCLGVATSDRPEGPFTDSGQPLQCGPGFVNIDPHAFDDPATGRKLLYWGSGFGPIKVRELAADRLHFAEGSREQPLIATDPSERPDNYRRLVEGAWVMRRGGWYYLFFSGDNCCGAKAHYAVMVARSRKAAGPFTTRPAPLDLVVAANGRWLAPGHNSVIADRAGRSWIFFHAVDRRRPRAKPADEMNTRRIMLAELLVWRNGWPEVAGKAPSSQPRPVPLTR